MSSVKLCYRPSGRAGYTGSLYLQVIHKRRVKKLSLPYRIFSTEWERVAKQIILTGSGIRRLYLQKTIEEINTEILCLENIIDELKTKGEFSLEDVVSLYREEINEEVGGSLSSFVCDQCKDLRRLEQYRTAHAYESAIRNLLLFLKKGDILLTDITPGTMKCYERHLMNTGKQPNTISFYMRNLRAIYNKARESGLLSDISINPFKDVYTGIYKTRKRALNRSQLQKLWELELPKSSSLPMKDIIKYTRLETAKLLFFFCLYARGMSFVDMTYLKKDNIKKGIICYYRKKTGQMVEIKVTAQMQQIIDHFSSQTRHSSYLFPIITNPRTHIRRQYECGLTRQNKLLKELSFLSGIKIPLSTHMARHSWASIAKQENLPLWVISEGLGHSNEQTTYIYLSLLERRVLDAANERVCTALYGNRKNNKDYRRKMVNKKSENINSENLPLKDAKGQDFDTFVY